MDLVSHCTHRMLPERFAFPCWLALAFAGVAMCQQGPAPGLGYKEIPQWPAPAITVAGTPAGPWNFGQVTAAAVTAQGNVLVLHRGAHPIMEFDPAGKFLRSWGNELISEGKVVAVPPERRAPGASGYTAVYGPAGCYSCGVHSVRVDRQGNIWVVDATGHIIYKMNPQGRVMMTLGTKGVSGMGPKNFNLPTDVAFAANGDIYVSDGYANPRVVKYTSGGKYLLQWGARGNAPGEFQLPHNLAVDAQGRVYVTDRDNQRIEVFDADGKFLHEWKTAGGVSTLFMTKDEQLWAGGTLYSLDGKVVGALPGPPGGHGTAVSHSGEVYIAQLSGKVQKFVKE